LAISKDTAIGYTGTGQRPANDATGWAAGANYVNSFDGIDVALSGTYYTEDQEDPSTTTTGGLISNNGTDSADRWTIGAEVGYMGFTLAADYADGTSGSGNDNTWWSVGAGYGTGPWSTHLTYEVGESSNSSGDNENTLVHAGVAYALGPGVTVGASLGFGTRDYERDSSDDDYTVFTTGVSVFF
jgi:predicted porin